MPWRKRAGRDTKSARGSGGQGGGGARPALPKRKNPAGGSAAARSHEAEAARVRRADRIHPKRPTCEEERPAHRRRPRNRRARRKTAPPETRAKNWRRRRKPVSGRDQAGRKPSARAKSAGFCPDTAATHRPRRVCERAAESAPRARRRPLRRFAARAEAVHPPA